VSCAPRETLRPSVRLKLSAVGSRNIIVERPSPLLVDGGGLAYPGVLLNLRFSA